METERLIIDPLKEADKEDYFTNISHDKRVLETFICKYAESLADFDFTPYLSAKNLFAIRLKETGKLIGIILYFDETEDSCEIGYGIGSGYWNRGYAGEAVKVFFSRVVKQILHRATHKFRRLFVKVRKARHDVLPFFFNNLLRANVLIHDSLLILKAERADAKLSRASRCDFFYHRCLGRRFQTGVQNDTIKCGEPPDPFRCIILRFDTV